MINISDIENFEKNFKKSMEGANGMLGFGLSSITGAGKSLVKSGDLTQLEYNKLKTDVQECINMAQQGRMTESVAFNEKIKVWMENTIAKNRKIRGEKEKKEKEKEDKELKEQKLREQKIKENGI